MPTWGWIAIVIAIAVIVVLTVALVVVLGRSRMLKRRFGPEYDRAVDLRGDRRQAESELAQRSKRHQQLPLHQLSPSSCREYDQSWRYVQSQFVDDPVGAVGRADELIQDVMRERGYPVEDFDQRADDLSVDHPQMVEHYRQGHRLALASSVRSGETASSTSTEDLRRAMRHYRSLFEELIEPAADTHEDATKRVYSERSEERK